MLSVAGGASILTDEEAEAEAARSIQRMYRKKAGRTRRSQGNLAGSRRKSDEGVPAVDKLRGAAICIQRNWRGYAVRRDRKIRLLDLAKGKTPIQVFRLALFDLMEDPDSSRAAKVISMVVLASILVSIICMQLQTMPELHSVPNNIWVAIEITTTVIFTAEYLLRLSVCNVYADDNHKCTEIQRWIRHPLNLCDLMAILPLYVEAVMFIGTSGTPGQGTAFRALRAIRLVRLFRVFKLGRYSSGLMIMFEAVSLSSQALLLLLFVLGMEVVLFGSVLFFIEKFFCPNMESFTPQQLTLYDATCANGGVHGHGYTWDGHLCCDSDGHPSDFKSIMDSCWWAVVTMTTVGYGDKYPKTAIGRIIGILCMLTGILLIALPTAIVGQKFQEVYRRHMQEGSRRLRLMKSHTAKFRAVTYAARAAGQARLSRENLFKSAADIAHATRSSKSPKSPKSPSGSKSPAPGPRQAWAAEKSREPPTAAGPAAGSLSEGPGPSARAAALRRQDSGTPSQGVVGDATGGSSGGERPGTRPGSRAHYEVLGDTGSSLTGPAGRIFYLLERAMETKKILADLQAREETLQLKLRDEVRSLGKVAAPTLPPSA